MKLTATAEDYARAFERERLNTYPLVDAFEARMGYAIDRGSLEEMARVLACPVKRNPPCWQHGRVIYSAVRRYAETAGDSPLFLDIGTAKGFSAMCLLLAGFGGRFAGSHRVVSVDVIDPYERVRRNTVAELDGPKTLAETLAPWLENEREPRITFLQSTGIEWLNAHHERLHVVFVDGKHSGPVVEKEAALICARQEPGDLCIFDDVHLPEIRAVVKRLDDRYAIEYLDILPNRGYAVAVKR